MTTYLFRSTLFGFSLAASLLTIGAVSPAVAYAAGALTVSDKLPQSLGGDTPYFYNTVTIQSGGVLSVIPLGTANGTGRLHIKANKIVIEPNGTLDASGAGFRGVANAAGSGTGGGGYEPDSSGGGGAFFGNGGAGTNAACGTGLFGVGGTKYGMVDTFGIGSAGGAGGKSPGPIGGSGGGSIILEAAKIEIYGTITVAGDPGISISGVGSGGGAGGEIRLHASQFVWGPNAKLIASGGAGGKASGASGGSGGGGLIWMRGAPAASTSTAVLDVSGGASVENCATGEGKGADGVIDEDATVFDCLDLDEDGTTATLCGGMDCDDADPAIKPGVKEICDIYDNDCNGMVNDGADICAAGLVCENMQCVAPTMPDGGTETDGGTPAAPEVIEYRGGCSVPNAPSGAAPIAAFGLAVAVVARMVRRSRKRR